MSTVCYACDRDAASNCVRCRRPFCDEHGRRYCDECARPETLLPSTRAYRTALVAGVVVLALSVWQFAAWPEAARSPVTTPQAGATARPAPPEAAATAQAGASPEPSPSPSPAPRRYAVQSGDTLLGIALRFDTTVEALVAANNLSSEDALLGLGQELVIP